MRPILTGFGDPYAGRIDRLRKIVIGEGFGAFLVTGLSDIRYLCGFTGTNGLLVVTAEDALFYTDFRYAQQALSEVRGAKSSTVQDLDAAASKELTGRNYGYLGLSGSLTTHRRWKRMTRLFRGVELADCENHVSALRTVKDDGELRKMEDAAKLSEEAFLAASQHVRPGCTEREAAFAFHVEALKLGAESLSFDTIIAAGERGALPHAKPTSRQFAQGDLVVFDFGVVLDGYSSDQTMTLPVGPVGEDARQIYEVVRKAQKAALAVIKPGAGLSEIDRAARETIAKAGYAEYFGHGTGHGVGIEVHEAPTVSPKSKEVAHEGMVFTIEPGIYLPGKFGVRLEDTVTVTENGWRALTSLPKDFGSYEP